MGSQRVEHNWATEQQNVKDISIDILSLCVCQFSSVTQSCLTLCDPMDYSMLGFPVHHQLPETTQTHVHHCRWCHPTISSSATPLSSHLQSFPASGSFPKSWFFASGGQSVGVSASAAVLPMNIQDWIYIVCIYTYISIYVFLHIHTYVNLIRADVPNDQCLQSQSKKTQMDMDALNGDNIYWGLTVCQTLLWELYM